MIPTRKDPAHSNCSLATHLGQFSSYHASDFSTTFAEAVEATKPLLFFRCRIQAQNPRTSRIVLDHPVLHISPILRAAACPEILLVARLSTSSRFCLISSSKPFWRDLVK